MPYAPPTKILPGAHSGFSEEDLKDLRAYIRENILAIDSKLEVFRTSKLPEYVRLYKGIPKNKEANFPWPGAANLVIQLIGTFCDELLSRIQGTIYQYDPLFPITLSGDTPETSGEEMKRALERFLMDEAYDPKSLDLYRVEQAFFNSAIKYGTGVVEFPWEYQVEQQYIYHSGGIGEQEPTQYELKEYVVRDAPRPRLVPLNKFGIDPKIPVLGDADFFYTIDTLSYWQVKDLLYQALYEGQEAALEQILSSPDRGESAEMQREYQASLSLSSSTSDARGGSEWDFYNCYMRYHKGGKTYSILAKYHKNTDKVLYIIFNNNPNNLFPIEDAKLAYDDEGYFGTGYAQMLRAYQTELSNNSNWRTNNRNFAMLGIFRVDPESKLSSFLQMYPGACIPGREGSIELIKPGADTGYSSEPDNFIMGCAKERAGVDPAISGTGGGLVNNKRGIYSASGTSMMLTQQNNRNNLRMSDMRAAHVRIAIKLMDLYSNIGIGDKLRKYGTQAEILKKAFEAYKSGALGFRLRPASASNNKELERQNDILLQGALSRFNQENVQMLDSLSKGAPAPIQQYLGQALLGNAVLFKDVLRSFNRDDTLRLLPDINQILKSMQGGNQGAGATGSAGSNSSTGGIGGAVPDAGVSDSEGIPT